LWREWRIEMIALKKSIFFHHRDTKYTEVHRVISV